jgi:hypothetical protein
MKKFVLFNTLKKAQHYVKHMNAWVKKEPYYNDGEQFCWYEINHKNVLCVSGWSCGCGCDRGHKSAYVIGRIK